MSDTDTDKGLTAAEAADLRRQLTELEGRATAAETRAASEAANRRKAEFATMSAQERALVSALEASESTISSLTAELDSAEQEIARLADEPGHGAEVAKLTRKMGQTAARLSAEEDRKARIEEDRASFQKTKGTSTADDGDTGQDDGQVVADGTPLKVFAPAARAWLEKRPRAFTDQAFMRKVRGAANMALADGIKENTADYFARIEELVGERQASAAEDEADDDVGGEEIAAEPEPRNIVSNKSREQYAPEKPQPRAAGPGSIVAPVTRQAARSGNQPRRKVASLTTEEREVADSLYGDIKNPADRYIAYAEGKNFMQTREPGHFVRHH